MLRMVKNEHLGLLVSGFQLTTTSTPGATVDVGGNDAASISRSSAGKAVITSKEAGLFKRAPIVLSSIGANVANGGFATFDTVAGSNAFTTKFIDSAAAADDGSGHVILAGFTNSQTDLVRSPLQRVRATFPLPVLHAYRITNNGTVAIGSGGSQASVVRNGTGDVTLTFLRPFARTVSAVAVGVKSSAVYCKIASLTSKICQVTTWDSSASALDADFMLFVLASNSSFNSGRMRTNLQVPQLEPRLIALTLVNTAGTPSIVMGGTTAGVDATVVDTGTGDAAITLTKPFLRAPCVICTGKTTNAQVKATPTTSGFSVVTFNGAGTATDDDVNILVLGYDSLITI